MKPMAKKQEPHNEKPISLKPLTVEEALRRAMQTPPEHRSKDKGEKAKP